MTPKRCRDIMFHLHVQEMERMRQKRTFPMPKVQPGDLVEVRYELSRSQETTATFQGFCIEVRNKFLNSGFVLKNTYDGVGVEQLVPRYSPRVLNVRVVRALQPRSPKVDPRPSTRNYRHMWHYFQRSKYSQGKRMLWRFHTPQRPGIMSLEPKIRAELKNLRRWGRPPLPAPVLLCPLVPPVLPGLRSCPPCCTRPPSPGAEDRRGPSGVDRPPALTRRSVNWPSSARERTSRKSCSACPGPSVSAPGRFH
ncbi:unnamed protein product [Prorocentrum cordatum]|uniref:50S ribosomal protein L19, chloroplastic n=1 Tax=Prorocentrum cordatum TaxID=2364126 RepID=A0ABN9XF55_9DINO|nr:unnamed protein product [Polarella glacialis]